MSECPVRQITLDLPNKHLQILILLEQGKTQKEIANELLCSKSNVKRIVDLLLVAYDSRNSTQLVAKVVRQGII